MTALCFGAFPQVGSLLESSTLQEEQSIDAEEAAEEFFFNDV